MSDPGLVEALTSASEQREFPDGTSYKSLSVARISELAQALKLSGREVEISALQAGLIPERYARNMKSFSPQEQARLLQSRVSVVGLGGLGGVVTELLSRMGVGILSLVDGDAFEESNLNRQTLSTEDRLDIPKAKEAAERVKEINSSVVVFSHQEYIRDDNAARLLSESDVIVDCLGNVTDRFVLGRAAKKLNCPVVSAAVAGDFGHVTTIFPGDGALERIHGEAESAPEEGVEASQGCLSHAVTLLAALECSEVVKILLNKGKVLRNKMLAIDLIDNSFELFELKPGA